MPRYKALCALAFLGVLISAGSVGSQDPFLARSEGESAATAVPIPYNPNATYAIPAEPVREPLAVDRPRDITPHAEPTANDAPPVAPAVGEPVAKTPHAKAVVEPQPIKVALAIPTPRISAPAVVPAPPAPAKPAPAKMEAAALTLPAMGGPLHELDDDLVRRESVAERRMLATVPDEIEPYFDLFMYVSKSTRGPLAQRMFVFQRDADGKLIAYADWRVSTGREKIELNQERKVRTTTPEGIFVLDPKRFYRRHWSKNWDNAPMHHAMFYDLMNNGRVSGLAIHAAAGQDKIKRLGKRDSAGCIRLSPKNAKELFYKIRNTTQGRVPVLEVNERGSTDRWGRIQHDEAGTMMMQDGYRAVLFVENFDGREEILGPVVAYTN